MAELVTVNRLMLEKFKMKKADKHEVLSWTALQQVLETVKNKEGDVYDKAAALLKELVRTHPFASGNRRTAFAAAHGLLLYNKLPLKIKSGFNPEILRGIREGHYADSEIRAWVSGGDMREWKRS